MSGRANWGRIAAFSLVTSIAIAVVLYLAVPDSRWITWVVLGLGLLDAAFLALVMPRLTGGEDVPIRDGDWGVAPPSEPAPPADPLDD